ncbi:MAG: hypothetical protein J5685_08355 [Clostridiales bacterium]|nr:hypothetical protein [Clostridiales bacterium]
MDTICDFVYDGTFDGLLCTVLRCINMRLAPSSIRPFDTLSQRTKDIVRIYTDRALAARFYEYIGNVASCGTARLISDFYLSASPDKETDIYILICKSIRHGAAVEGDFSDGLMDRVQNSVCDLYREAQTYLREISFRKSRDIDVAVISPVNSILPIIKGNILRREELGDVTVFDRNHGVVLVRRSDISKTVYTGGKSVPENAGCDYLADRSRDFLYRYPELLHCG